MYQVIIKSDENSAQDFFSTKREVLRFIARETGVSQTSIRNEIAAQDDSEIKRDTLGFRVEILFS